ncbi:hypothetical protein OSB04_018849 [Centaurea solstitialis]|uniref:Reverse transcriptase Ty1/copia-type domain-containing protein n=1 Tax=Centaurea solstitialis TaxID=347529 RepID=A0AA38WFB0_9ASTR|nr:hypothetical protein OSB04_018849 [Centaurea solstitialis]
MWLFKKKYHTGGSLDRYKAHLFANGKSQRTDISCDETFSPVVKPTTICTILSLAVSHHRPINHLDKSLYGLKQAPSAWFQRFASFIIGSGFTHNKLDSSLFIYRQGRSVAYFLLYVDETVLKSSTSSLLHIIIKVLAKDFAMIDLGSLSYFLGISATHHRDGLFLCQRKL